MAGARRLPRRHVGHRSFAFIRKRADCRAGELDGRSVAAAGADLPITSSASPWQSRRAAGAVHVTLMFFILFCTRHCVVPAVLDFDCRCHGRGSRTRHAARVESPHPTVMPVRVAPAPADHCTIPMRCRGNGNTLRPLSFMFASSVSKKACRRRGRIRVPSRPRSHP